VVVAIGSDESRERLLEQDASDRQLAAVLERPGEVVAISRNRGVVVAVGLAVPLPLRACGRAQRWNALLQRLHFATFGAPYRPPAPKIG
jgi:hypothetical protein